MKKYLALSLVFVTLLTLSACGNKTDTTTNKKTDSAQTNTIEETSTNNSSNQTATMNKDTKTNTNENLSDEIAVINTDKGTIEISFYPEVTNTVNNFKKLIAEGFYDGLTFHRVVPGFVIQGGDPNGDGTGGSTETVDLEIPCNNGVTIVGKLADENCSVKYPHKKGVLAMARSADPNSASSQFYITLEEQKSLDGKYTVFWEVISGMDVVAKISKDDKINTITIK